jgi:hypothetical protein
VSRSAVTLTDPRWAVAREPIAAVRPRAPLQLAVLQILADRRRSLGEDHTRATGRSTACCTSWPSSSCAGLLYRKWPGQMTNHRAHTDEIERPARMAIIRECAQVLAALCRRSLNPASPAAEGLP